MEGWSSEDGLLFHWDVRDTLQRQDVLLDLRHDQSYPYSNLYVFLTYRFPNGKSRVDTVECTLANEKGEWRGSGFGDLVDQRFLFQSGIQFPFGAGTDWRSVTGCGTTPFRLSRTLVCGWRPIKSVRAHNQQPEGRLARSLLAGRIFPVLQRCSTERLMKPIPSLSTMVALVLALAAGTVFGQHLEHHDTHPCGLHEAGRALFLRRPELRALSNLAEAQLEAETLSASRVSAREEVLIIPIVFHISHFTGPENISTAQIYDAVDVLNTNMRALNDNIGDVIPEFEDLVADIEIEFRLAQRDPQGNCHPGINRVVSELTYAGDYEMKQLIQWPRNKYLNVWVCEDAAGAAGYTQYPQWVQGSPEEDGIVIQHRYTGSIGTSNAYRSRTLTHEVGHG